MKQLTSGAGEAAPMFSPDGKWVVCNSGSYSSWKVPADGGELTPITKDGWPSDISADGKLLACVRPAGAGPLRWTITIMPFAGGPPLKTFDVTSESRPSSRWTPDGRALVYNLTRGGVSFRSDEPLDSVARRSSTETVDQLHFRNLLWFRLVSRWQMARLRTRRDDQRPGTD